MKGAEAELNREIREIVQHFSKAVPDEVIAAVLVSNAFLVNLRESDVRKAAARIGSIADALSASLGSPSPAPSR